MTEPDASIGFYVLDNILVIMVGGGAIDVELHEVLAFQSGKQLMDLVKQPELADVVLFRPVGHHMEVDQWLCPVFDSGHDGMPLEGHKFDEHCRAWPWSLLLEELYIVVP